MKNLTRTIQNEIRKNRNKKSAQLAQKFFKTGRGQYGEGDVFLGLSVPFIRKIVKKYLKSVDLNNLTKIIKSKYHEERFFVVTTLAELSKLVYKKKHSSNYKLLKIYKNFYFKNIKYINNWDLVDVSAEHVVGSYYYDKSHLDLIKLAKQNHLWKKRVAVISTFYFIRRGQFNTTLQICKILINDKHDLIHKATGWMLREVGKRNKGELLLFLNKHAHQMPRTMLRYSIEKLSSDERKKYLYQK